jgi:phosphonate transport system substrate-binding protein
LTIVKAVWLTLASRKLISPAEWSNIKPDDPFAPAVREGNTPNEIAGTRFQDDHDPAITTLKEEKMKHLILTTALLVLMALAAACSSGAPALGTAANPIVMTFVPSGDTNAIAKGGNQVADMLKAKTNLTYQVQVGTSYAASIEAMGANKAQIGWLNTFSYLLAHDKYGVNVALVVIRNKASTYNAQFIAGANTGINAMADLKGKKFCFVDPNSTSGYIIPQIMMKAGGIDPAKDLAASTNAGSHPNVVTAVYKGDCDAGATFVDARSAIAKDHPDVNDKVKVFLISDPIPNDTVSFTKDFPADIKDKTVQALLDIAAGKDGAAALQTIYSIGGFEKHDDTFYDQFRGLLKKAGVDVSTMVQ